MIRRKDLDPVLQGQDRRLHLQATRRPGEGPEAERQRKAAGAHPDPAPRARQTATAAGAEMEAIEHLIVVRNKEATRGRAHALPRRSWPADRGGEEGAWRPCPAGISKLNPVRRLALEAVVRTLKMDLLIAKRASAHLFDRVGVVAPGLDRRGPVPAEILDEQAMSAFRARRAPRSCGLRRRVRPGRGSG